MTTKRLYKCQNCSMIFWGHELLPDAESFPPILTGIQCPDCGHSGLIGQGTPGETAVYAQYAVFAIAFFVMLFLFRLNFLVAAGAALVLSLATRLILRRLYQPGNPFDDQVFAANELAHAGESLQHAGNLRAAKKAFERALVILDTGVDMKLEGAIVGRLANAEKALGEFVPAREHYETALEIARKLDARSDIVNRLNNLAAMIADDLHDPSGAIGYAEQAVAQARGLQYSPERLARMLSNLSKYEREVERYEQAKSHVAEAMEIVRRTEYREVEAEALLVRAQIAIAENRLADALMDLNRALAMLPKTGQHPLRETIRQSIEVTESALRAGAPVTILPAGVAPELAGQSSVMFDPLEVGPEAFRVLKRAEEHEQVGQLLVALENYRLALTLYEIRKQPRVSAIIEMTIGDILRVCGQIEESIAVLQTALGHARQAADVQVESGVLLNLGIALRTKGSWDESRQLLEGAVERARQCGDSETVARGQVILGNLSRDAGEFDLAEALYREAEVSARQTGDSELLASINLSRGNLYFRQRRWQEAKPHYEYALEYARQQRKRHLQGTALHMLGNIYRRLGDNGKALDYLRQAISDDVCYSEIDRAGRYNDLAVVEQNLERLVEARDHFRRAAEHYENLKVVNPDVAGCFENLGVLLIRSGDVPEGRAYVMKASEMDNSMIAQSFALASEEIRLNYLKQTEARLNDLVSLIAQGGPLEHDRETVAACADIVFARKGVTLETLAVQKEIVASGSQPELNVLAQELTHIKDQIARLVFADAKTADNAEMMDALTKQRRRLEQQAAQHIPQSVLDERLQRVDHLSVADALPPESVLVEFLRFALFPFPSIDQSAGWEAPHYAAFIMRARQPASITIVDLGSADAIDRLVDAYLADVTNQVGNETHGDELRRVLFDPLLREFGGLERLLIAPDMGLTRLPFEILPLDHGLHVIDEFEVSYLSAARDLLRLCSQPTGFTAAPVVMAAPDFSLSADASSLSAEDIQAILDSGNKPLFAPLEGTREEGTEVAALLGVEPCLGAQALKSRVKACKSPRVLHIASHGFFLTDSDKARNVGRLANGLDHPNPLARSGLALAGAETWNNNGRVPAQAEDGILTAEDVSGLDLLNTELVVLSACDTGLGETYGGESVFGFRRAFVLAGAQSLVMSLWKVPDRETKALMVRYYRNLIEARKPRAEALRLAQLDVKKQHPQPYYWGAFVSQGAITPLPSGDAVSQGRE